MRFSLVIPVYNEEKRLPARLVPYLSYLEKKLSDFEAVVVNDGSTDGTAEMLAALQKKYPYIRVLTSRRNRGRGYGMREGILAAEGEYILETDADLPVGPEEALTAIATLDEHPEYDILIGSRAHPETAFLRPQSPLRVFAGNVFHLIFRILFGTRLRDVMCGFKLFRRKAARDIFAHVFDERYLAPAEAVYLAARYGYPVKEIPVRYEDNRESKVRVVKDTIRTLWGLSMMLWRRSRGWYEKETTVAFAEAAREVKRRMRGRGWPSLFAKIRFITAPYARLAALVPTGGTIIDLGAGYGLFAHLIGILSPARRVIGLDLDRYKIANALHGTPNVALEVGDITNADVPSADAILLIHVLHHLHSYDEQETLLKATFAKLRPGGVIVIAEINRRPWWKFELTKLADHLLYPGDIIYYRFPEALLPILKRLSPNVEEMSADTHTPFSHVLYVVKKPKEERRPAEPVTSVGTRKIGSTRSSKERSKSPKRLGRQGTTAGVSRRKST